MNVERTTVYAAATSACVLLPVPLVDTYVQNRIRTRMVRDLADRRGLSLTAAQVEELALEPLWDTSSVMRSVVVWPVKKLMGRLFWFLHLRDVVRSYRDCQQRAERIGGELGTP
jgi:hypothetical protein